MNKYLLPALALSAGIGISGSVNAASINLPAGIAVLEDNNLEYVLDENGEIKTSGTLVVGDTLVAFITFEEVQDGSANTVQSLGAPGTELTGISAITISAILPGGSFAFAPSGLLGSYTSEAGALAVLFDQNAGDFTTGCHVGGVVACETAATNGSHWMTVGFGDADDFWIASSAVPLGDLSTVTLESVAAGAATNKFAVANYALSILENSTGFTFNQQSCGLFAAFCAGDGFVDLIGSGDILGGTGLTSPFLARSDFDFQLDRVPEPATIGLIGLGLLGLGAVRRKKSI